MRNTYAQDHEISLHPSAQPSCGDRRDYPQAMGRRLYTPLSEQAKKGGKVTSTGSQSDQYWSPRQPVLVTMGEQYCSDQRPVLVVIAPSEVARYSPHREHDAEERKREQIANMGGLHFGGG